MGSRARWQRRQMLGRVYAGCRFVNLMKRFLFKLCSFSKCVKNVIVFGWRRCDAMRIAHFTHTHTESAFAIYIVKCLRVCRSSADEAQPRRKNCDLLLFHGGLCDERKCAHSARDKRHANYTHISIKIGFIVLIVHIFCTKISPTAVPTHTHTHKRWVETRCVRCNSFVSTYYYYALHSHMAN